MARKESNPPFATGLSAAHQGNDLTSPNSSVGTRSTSDRDRVLDERFTYSTAQLEQPAQITRFLLREIT
jgi:hypothetical protein